MDDISAHLFCYLQDTYHWSSAVPERFKGNINEELYQAMITSTDIEVVKDLIFKKYLNAGYPRTFTYSVLKVFDDISIH